MKKSKFITTFLLVLMFLACTKKSDIKTFDFYNVYVSTNNEKENETNRALSGSITIDENQKIVTFLFNGTNYSMNYKIIEKNKPIYFEYFNLLMSKASGTTDCTDAYELSLVNTKVDNMIIENYSVNNSTMLYFASIKSRSAAIIFNGSNFIIYGVSLRKKE